MMDNRKVIEVLEVIRKRIVSEKVLYKDNDDDDFYIGKISVLEEMDKYLQELIAVIELCENTKE